MTEHIDYQWTVGPYTFEAVSGHGFSWPEFPKVMYRFRINGESNGEAYQSLDRAMIAAVGEKHTGPRGASGSGVGTAADWFGVMIGLDHVEDAKHMARTLPSPCWYEGPHTRETCGNKNCQES